MGIAVVESKRDNYEALREICERHHVRRLDLHGSSWAEDDNPAEPSELNFLVEFNSLSETEQARMYLALEAALEEFFGREVGLVTTDGIKMEWLRKVITRRRTPIYPIENQERP